MSLGLLAAEGGILGERWPQGMDEHPAVPYYGIENMKGPGMMAQLVRELCMVRGGDAGKGGGGFLRPRKIL